MLISESRLTASVVAMSVTAAQLLLSLGVASLGMLVALYAYVRYSYSYWKEKGVVYLEPTFPFGNIADAMLQKKSTGLIFQDIYNRLEGHRFGGTFSFTRPMLVVREPEMIKTILVKDFANFHDHGTYFDEKGDPLSAHLFMLTGQRWRNLRTRLTPTFTSGKMKAMFQILVDCGNDLKAHVDECAANGEMLEVKDILAKFSTDVIASFAFGIQCNCLKDPDAEFRKWGRRIFQGTIKSGIRDVLMFIQPTVAAVLKIPFVPQDVTHYFKKMVEETVEYRENNNVTRNDFIQLLIQLKNKGIVNTEKQVNGVTKPDNGRDVALTMTELAAQAFVFFVAGFETSSTTMSFCLYELALNPDIQERVQKEVDTVVKKYENEVTYEAIQEMEYLDNVICGKLCK
jgi:cytochrome P450 family 6